MYFSFLMAKIFWFLFNPLNVFLFITSFTFIAFLFRLRIIKFIFLFTWTLLLLFIFIFPTGNYLIHILEKKYNQDTNLSNFEKIDGLLILGGSTDPYLSHIYNQIIFMGSAERLFESTRIIKQFPNAKVIFSGGSNKLINNNYTESDNAKQFFNEMDISQNKIIYENKSRNTFENIFLSKQISNYKKGEVWIVISSAYHLNRAILVAEKLDWKLLPYATDFQQPKKINFFPNFNLFSNLAAIQLASHEWVGLIAYYLMGRISKIY